MLGLTEHRFVAKHPYNRLRACRKCVRPFIAGDRIVSKTQGRGSSRTRRWGYRRKYYHEECWEKLFL